MKQISEELLKEILEYINDAACRIEGEWGDGHVNNIGEIKENNPNDYSVLLYEKVSDILNGYDL
ncbi:hypothetical protein SNE25_21100 [Mucilaginibacter sabulilitoris]|uniref:Uncharacterized protein n=1 Tax=Mucilaginibacter sabulilitoris TaxID=1173583 RepID=A0ABZ0THX7_9SPHI|nr:hypothetical protein [Mucilaginibacter sabulilitoris]WPU91818.1 hypothetical protein SNE25_21100 [Mucilaginibacter sabulilitoris]